MPAEPNTVVPLRQKISFGVGHVLNDLCASMWFSYLLIYFHHVIYFSNQMAGNLLLLGQVVDAVTTPFIGYESDRVQGVCNYGKRKSWHLLGTICVVCSFPFLFTQCINCAGADNWALFIYYAPFVVIFQFGWAATQISHLSLIPVLSSCESERVGLNAIRYAFTVIANITVYGVAWLLLDLHMSSKVRSHDLSKADAPQFRNLALIVVGCGSLFSVIFHVGTREKRREEEEDSGDVSPLLNQGPTPKTVMKWKDWLRQPQFYQVALLYMCTRLVVNISQIYLPMYLTDTLDLAKDSIAIIPLIVYMSGFVASLAMKIVNKKIGRKPTYLAGALLVLGSCTWFWFTTSATDKWVYGAAAMLGVGGSTILITSLSMTADLIGEQCQSGAFVYGAMSFTDKLSNGIAVLLIQSMHPCLGCCPDCQYYYRNVMVFVPGGMAALAILILLTLVPFKIGALKNAGSVVVEGTDDQGVLNGSASLHSPINEGFGASYGAIGDDSTVIPPHTNGAISADKNSSSALQPRTYST